MVYEHNVQLLFQRQISDSSFFHIQKFITNSIFKIDRIVNCAPLVLMVYEHNVQLLFQRQISDSSFFHIQKFITKDSYNKASKQQVRKPNVIHV